MSNKYKQKEGTKKPLYGGSKEDQALWGRLFPINTKNSDFEEVDIAKKISSEYKQHYRGNLKEGSGVERLMNRNHEIIDGMRDYRQKF